MLLIPSDTPIGIELVDFYAPETRRSISDCAGSTAVDFTGAGLPVIWNWTKDPDSLLRFFDSESSAAQDFTTTFAASGAERFVDHSGIDFVRCATAESCADMTLNVAKR